MDSSPQPYHSSEPLPPRPTSSGPLIAGLLTATALGSAGGLYYWMHGRAHQSQVNVVGIEQSGTPVPQSSPSISAPPIAVAPLDSETDTSPTSTVKQIVRGLLSRDEQALERLLGQTLGSDERRVLLDALTQGRLTVDGRQPVTDLGPTASGERWAVNLLSPGSLSADRLLLDFTRKDASWILASATLPDKLREQARVATTAPGSAGAQASSFLDSLLARDFGALKSMVNPAQVTDEKIAALGMIFDEAKFELPKDPKALKTTSVAEDRAWVVAKIHSPSYQLDSEFGLELKKEGDTWMIDRVNLSSLMQGFASLAEDDNAFQSPLVQSPNGGDSLVLYFGYDDDKLTARSLKQVAVVASLLKQSTHKKIQIGGHADALGEDHYNDALSQRRAAKVAETLQSFGVRNSQIHLEAFGERLPLSPNLNPDGSDNPEGRVRNRRAEIYLDF